MVRHPNPNQLSWHLVFGQSGIVTLMRTCVCLFALALLAAPSSHGQQAAGDGPSPNPPPPPVAATPVAKAQAGGETPRTSTAAEMRQQEALKSSADLLKMATQLKLELDKTSSETLSINVIRRAADIERLAHSVRESLRLQASTN